MDSPKTALPMHTLLLCSDVQFLGTTRGVLNQLQVTPSLAANCDEAVFLIESHEFDAIIVDWREISNLGDFLTALRRSKLNRESVLVAIVRDLLDLRQAFAAGVLFLIHKPPSTLQIERCLRAAYCATVARRRKQHREPVNLLAAASTRTEPYAEVIVTNLSEGGAGILVRDPRLEAPRPQLSSGDELDLRFVLPETDTMIHTSGRLVWTTNEAAGIRFTSMPESDRGAFQSWLTGCVERSLAALCERLRCA